jgi:hypothetical protein
MPVHGVSGAQAILLHAHVELRVLLKREPAVGFIELERRNAQIEHDAVHQFVRREIAKPTLHEA